MLEADRRNSGRERRDTTGVLPGRLSRQPAGHQPAGARTADRRRNGTTGRHPMRNKEHFVSGPAVQSAGTT